MATFLFLILLNCGQCKASETCGIKTRLEVRRNHVDTFLSGHIINATHLVAQCPSQNRTRKFVHKSQSFWWIEISKNLAPLEPYVGDEYMLKIHFHCSLKKWKTNALHFGRLVTICKWGSFVGSGCHYMIYYIKRHSFYFELSPP